jgi:hypothetical protein
MDLTHQSVENRDAMAALDECINDMRADESGAAGNQNIAHGEN